MTSNTETVMENETMVDATEQDATLEDGVVADETQVENDNIGEDLVADDVHNDEVVDADANDDGDEEEEDDEHGEDDEHEEDEEVSDDGSEYVTKGVGKSIGKSIGKGRNIGTGQKSVIVKRPPRKISAAMREKRFNAKVKKLAVTDIKSIIQYAPFQRMIVNALSDGVERVSTIAIHALMDAAVNYAHEIYNDSYTITKISNKKKTLMLRHVAGAMYAKGTVARPPTV